MYVGVTLTRTMSRLPLCLTRHDSVALAPSRTSGGVWSTVGVSGGAVTIHVMNVICAILLYFVATLI